ncbi:hypothetical protein [Hyphomonas sp. ND6WE1B]|uniref:hypothetical protein n=1 Tax=Hyphomonas sp. ND6WE1B TaxID=1848191 RepID=UPI0011121783|nr:hypothetical protein [Hyphomonas sp. ND6WE1B]
MSQQPPEQDRRTARKILRAKTAQMSNAKWRKLFSALHHFPGGCAAVEIKLVGHRNGVSVPTPGPHFEFEDHFGECGGISFVPFSHIEFVRVSNAIVTSSELIQHLHSFGKWPITAVDEGILIHGYNWS